jgi:hypothetical protein
LLKRQKKSINYKLDLLKNIKVFLVFYILLLKLANLTIFYRIYFISIYRKRNNIKLRKFYNRKIRNILLSKKKIYFQKYIKII